MPNLQEQFGPIDIYLFDQLLRGRITPGMKILDAGCGMGRNLVYLLREGYEVFGVDSDAEAIQDARRLAGSLAPKLPAENFRAEAVEAMSFPNEFADVVISSAVLHFARDDHHFNAMLQGTWRALRPQGLFFCRLASTIGMEDLCEPLGGGLYRLPDRSERYLVDKARLLELIIELGGEFVDPLKTTLVHGQRSMTTLILRKHAADAQRRGRKRMTEEERELVAERMRKYWQGRNPKKSA